MRLLTVVLLSAGLLLSACAAPAMIAGGAAAAGYVGLQSRPTKQIAADTNIKILIKDQLTQLNYKYLTDIGVDVFYNDVMLTGIVPTREDGEKVLDVARRTQGVSKVYNELFVGAQYSSAQKVKDAWIAAQIQPRLLADKNAFPLNYLISVVNGHAYIMGTASTGDEYQHVLHILRTTSGVVQVHDYIVMGKLSPEETGNIATGGADWLSNMSKQGQAPDPFSGIR